jgi:hypothetical protein
MKNKTDEDGVRLAEALLNSSDPACRRVRQWLMEVAAREVRAALDSQEPPAEVEGRTFIAHGIYGWTLGELERKIVSQAREKFFGHSRKLKIGPYRVHDSSREMNHEMYPDTTGPLHVSQVDVSEVMD